jgi:hypothetical protein
VVGEGLRMETRRDGLDFLTRSPRLGPLDV